MDRSTVGTFERLGHPVRAAILAALVESRREEYGLADALGDHYDPGSERGRTVPFTELRERAGVEDPGEFDRHLDDLRGPFLERTAEGYRLTHAGRRLAGVIAGAGGAGADGGHRRAVLDEPCRRCGGAIEAAYADGHLAGECEHCGPLFDGRVPPGVAADRPVAELVGLHSRVATAGIRLVVDGVCERCHAPIDPRVRQVVLDGAVAGGDTDREGRAHDGHDGGRDHDGHDGGHDHAEGGTGTEGDDGTGGGTTDDGTGADDEVVGGDADDPVDADADDDATGGDAADAGTVAVYAATCSSCGNHNVLSTAAVALVDPRVEAFYRDHGDGPPGVPHWTLDLFDPEGWTTESADPLRERFVTARDGERLRVTVAETEAGRLETLVERSAVGGD